MRKINDQLELKGAYDGVFGCGKSKITSEKHIESLIELAVKRELESRRPSISLSLNTIITDRE
jgi:hypothetical protein